MLIRPLLLVLLVATCAAAISRPAHSQTIPWDQIMGRWDAINSLLPQPAASASKQAQEAIEAHKGQILVDPLQAHPGVTRFPTSGPTKGWQRNDFVSLRADILDLALQRSNVKEHCPSLSDSMADQIHLDCLIALLIHEATHATENQKDPTITDPDKQEACWEVEAQSAQLDFLNSLASSPLYCCGPIGGCLAKIIGIGEDILFNAIALCFS